MNVKKILRLLTHPVEQETRKVLKEKWEELPHELQTPQQIYGRNEEGCGATIGVMPRCNFSCQGCYLGSSANKTPFASIDSIKEQLKTLRGYLGQWGNLQLTDGEVTLRPLEDLIEILKEAKRVELIPMLMTHGDEIRKNPDLLKRLMVDGGLEEVSFHVDITQRGRLGESFRNAQTESELNPLRSEIAELVRKIRRETGLPLRVASTLTITPDNVGEIPDLMAWFMEHSDVFRLISFLPMAQVGRTQDGLGGKVSQEKLWREIGLGLYPHSAKKREDLSKKRWWMGDSRCNQFLMGFVREDAQEGRSYQTLSMNASRDSFYSRFFHRFGGITFRADTKMEAICRFIGMVSREPVLMMIEGPRLAFKIFRNEEPFLKVILKKLRGQIKMERFTVVSHHFMGEDEMKSDEGRERLDRCIFKVADGDELVSMCQFNGEGRRERFYRTLREQKDEVS